MLPCLFFFFFFNDTATTEIYTLSLHDALPILHSCEGDAGVSVTRFHLSPQPRFRCHAGVLHETARSEEHTSELQSQSNLVCRLLLEKKNKTNTVSNSTSTRIY